jgi:hypothetical protein
MFAGALITWYLSSANEILKGTTNPRSAYIYNNALYMFKHKQTLF